MLWILILLASILLIKFQKMQLSDKNFNNLLKSKNFKNLKPNSVIFTFNTLMCVPNLKINSFNELTKKKPKAVIHFEAFILTNLKICLKNYQKNISIIRL